MQSKRSINQAHWATLVAESEMFNGSAAEFCRERGIVPASFYLWRKKLKEQRSDVNSHSLASRGPFSRCEVVDSKPELPDARWLAEFLQHLLRVSP
jgi:transposase-like protein